VDLVKATADHQLLFGLLRKYGAPDKLVRAVKTLYTNESVNIQVGKEKFQILHTIGIQQGDNMAPVLFVFLIKAFAETLEQRNGKASGESTPCSTGTLSKSRPSKGVCEHKQP
jgi:hypothetical protein